MEVLGPRELSEEAGMCDVPFCVAAAPSDARLALCPGDIVFDSHAALEVVSGSAASSGAGDKTLVGAQSHLRVLDSAIDAAVENPAQRPLSRRSPQPRGQGAGAGPAVRAGADPRSRTGPRTRPSAGGRVRSWADAMRKTVPCA